MIERKKSAATIIGVKQISQLYFLTKDLKASLKEINISTVSIINCTRVSPKFIHKQRNL